MARGLDSYGFSDLMVSIGFHVAITYKLRKDNPLKFQLSTPREVMRCMTRCWSVDPTSERVRDDIESWDFAIDKIIAARGTVVHGLALRHGHRLMRTDGKGECTTRVSNKQRKEYMLCRPVHEDAVPSFSLLSGVEDQLDIARAVVDAQEETEFEALAAERDLEFGDDDNGVQD